MKHKPREFWEPHVQGLAESGQTLRAYCAAHGLNRNTLNAWRRRIVAPPNGHAEAGPAFVRVRMKPPVRRSEALTLCWPSGVELRVPVGCDTAWLSQLLSGLR